MNSSSTVAISCLRTIGSMPVRAGSEAGSSGSATFARRMRRPWLFLPRAVTSAVRSRSSAALVSRVGPVTLRSRITLRASAAEYGTRNLIDARFSLMEICGSEAAASCCDRS